MNQIIALLFFGTLIIFVLTFIGSTRLIIAKTVLAPNHIKLSYARWTLGISALLLLGLVGILAPPEQNAMPLKRDAVSTPMTEPTPMVESTPMAEPTAKTESAPVAAATPIEVDDCDEAASVARYAVGNRELDGASEDTTLMVVEGKPPRIRPYALRITRIIWDSTLTINESVDAIDRGCKVDGCMSSEPIGQVGIGIKRGSDPSELKLWLRTSDAAGADHRWFSV